VDAVPARGNALVVGGRGEFPGLPDAGDDRPTLC